MGQAAGDRHDFLCDVLITAAEDGGVNSWRNVEEYDYRTGHLVINELDIDGEPMQAHRVTLDVLRRGFTELETGAVTLNPIMLTRIVGAKRANDAGSIDAFDADAVVQAGLFGQLIYG